MCSIRSARVDCRVDVPPVAGSGRGARLCGDGCQWGPHRPEPLSVPRFGLRIGALPRWSGHLVCLPVCEPSRGGFAGGAVGQGRGGGASRLGRAAPVSAGRPEFASAAAAAERPRLTDEPGRSPAETSEGENCAGRGHRWVVSGTAPRAAHHPRGGERPTCLNDLDGHRDVVICTAHGSSRMVTPQDAGGTRLYPTLRAAAGGGVACGAGAADSPDRSVLASAPVGPGSSTVALRARCAAPRLATWTWVRRARSRP
jgi:hypothetical protein